MAQLIASTLRAGSPRVEAYRTNASASTSVRPTTAAIPVRTVVTTSDFEKKKIMYADSPRSGTRSALETTTTSATSAVIRSMRDQRSGVSVSSSRRSRSASRIERPPAGSWPVTALPAIMADDHDSRGADAHQLFGRALERDPDGKALRDADPVQVALDWRHAGDAEVVELGDRRPDALHASPEVHPGRAHHVAGHPVARADRPKLRLAKIGDDEPLRGVDQGEQRLDATDHLAD